MVNKSSKPAGVFIILLLIFFQALSGLIGGIGLVLDPSGRSLQIPIGWLEYSPFNDYLIPGLILLIVLGIFPIIVFYIMV